jgi:hypothetical protein
MNVDHAWKYDAKRGLYVCGLCGAVARIQTLDEVLEDFEPPAFFLFDDMRVAVDRKVCRKLYKRVPLVAVANPANVALIEAIGAWLEAS